MSDFNQLGRRVAVGSLVGGALYFLVYFFTANSMLVILGYMLMPFVIGVNLAVLLLVLWKTRSQPKRERTRTAGMMLGNIPIALLYFWCVTMLANTVRLSVRNETGKMVTNIQFQGCTDKKLTKLIPNEVSHVWFRIPGDCSLQMEYTIDREVRTDKVIGYATRSGAQIVEYKIK